MKPNLDRIILSSNVKEIHSNDKLFTIMKDAIKEVLQRGNSRCLILRETDYIVLITFSFRLRKVSIYESAREMKERLI